MSQFQVVEELQMFREEAMKAKRRTINQELKRMWVEIMDVAKREMQLRYGP